MTYLVADDVSTKSSKLLNVSYFAFGYVVALFWLSPVSIDYEIKISSIVILGGVIGTFVYYVKPTELIMSFYLHIRKFNTINFGKSFSLNERDTIYKKSDLLRSPYLKEDLSLITGAFLFAFSILLSGRLLQFININLPNIFFLPPFFVMLLVGIWETRNFLRQKLDCVMYYYYFRKNERPLADEMLDSIKNRDWVGAQNILHKSIDKGSIFALRGGICGKCRKIRKEGPYCNYCGSQLLIVCKECKAPILREGLEKNVFPRFCAKCGQKLNFPQ